ncbi:MAG: M23 family metallopeptidase [Ardenticatenaceae bacterium]|nr:M23 family metallopeptidase [Ardenticatenaceae bacterium]
MRKNQMLAGFVFLPLLLCVGCTMTGLVENPALLNDPIYWAAATDQPLPTVTFLSGSTTPVYAPSLTPFVMTTTPDWTTVTPQNAQTATPYWVTTTPQMVTATPSEQLPPTTTPGLPIIGFTTPQPATTPYYRIGSFYMHSDVYIGGAEGIVVRITGHETMPSPQDADATYHFLTVRVTNFTAEEKAVLLSDLFFIREVWLGEEIGSVEQIVQGRWVPQNEPLLARGLPDYAVQQLAPLLPDEQRDLVLAFVVPNGTVRELGLITHWDLPLEGGQPVWFYLEPDPLGPFIDAVHPPPPTPVLLDDGVTPVSGGSGSWPTTGVITRGFGCHSLYTGISGEGFGCPADRPWFHNGVDIANSAGTIVWSPIDGTITYAGPDSSTADCSDMAGSQPPHFGLGNYQRLVGQGNGGAAMVHYFGHLRDFLTTGGDVAAGQPVAEMGSTGCSTGSHLHWIVYLNGNLIDPAIWAGPGPPP